MPPVPETALGTELFELMQGPSGATSAAVRGKHNLMSLQYVRAESPSLDGSDAQEEAVAITARELIEEATRGLDKEISQREHTDADRGAAARYLLALEQGTAAMPLHERRKRAAKCLHMKDVGSLRHPHENKSRGVMESPETRLMDAVAHRLMEREADYLRRLDASKERSEIERTNLRYKLVHRVWEVAGDLASSVRLASCPPAGFGDMYPPERDMESLHYFGWFWKLVSRPDPATVEDMRSPQAETAKLFPLGLIAEMYVLQPFPYETIEHLTASIIVESYVGSTPVMRILLKPWRIWLESCSCPAGGISPACKVHRFCAALMEYQKLTEECWTKLRDPRGSPGVYGSNRTPEEWLDWYCIVASIDKTSRNSV